MINKEVLIKSEYIDLLEKENAELRKKCNKLIDEIKRQKKYALNKRNDAHYFSRELEKIRNGIIIVEANQNENQIKMVKKLQEGN